MATLVLTLPPTAPGANSSCQAWRLDSEHGNPTPWDIPSLALAASRSDETVVLVPAPLLSWHQVRLPAGSLPRGMLQEHTRLRQVLVGLLEDQLLDDPDTLHFALQPQPSTNEPVWVAVCARAWLLGWLSALEQAGHSVSRILPMTHPLPAGTPPRAALVDYAEQVQLLVQSHDGCVLLPLASQARSLLAPAPERVFTEPALASAAEPWFPQRVDLQTPGDRVRATLQTSWDLAQFDLLRSRRARLRKVLSTTAQTLLRHPAWKPARWGLVLLLACNLAGLQAWAWKAQAQHDARQQEMRYLLTRTFPDVRVVIDAPAQMQRALADLQRQGGAVSGSSLEAMLARLHTLAPELPPPLSLEFVPDALSLRLPTGTSLDAQTLDQRLRSAGYQVQIQGETLTLRTRSAP